MYLFFVLKLTERSEENIILEIIIHLINIIYLIIHFINHKRILKCLCGNNFRKSYLKNKKIFV